MKLFAILCLVGFAAAATNRVGWKPNSEYRYQYEGRLLSGIPELASHYSGLGLNCTVSLRVGDNQRSFVLQIENPKYVRVNQHLPVGNRQEERNWRQIPLPEFHSISGESRRVLEEPTPFKLKENGEFESLTVSGQEPEWSVNFKKALVVLFQTQFNVIFPSVETNVLKPKGSNQADTFWRNFEESVDGYCEVYYELNELPEGMVREQPELFPNPQDCRGKKFYELIKTKDVNNCKRRTSFSYYKPGFFRCPTGNCDGQWARSSITRYYVCGDNEQQDLQVQRIVNEGELQQNLIGFKTEKFLTGTRQVLKLTQSPSSSSSHMRQQEPSSPVTLKSLLYEYNLKKTVRVGGEHVLDQAELERDASMYQALPRHSLTSGSANGQESHNKIREISGQVKSLFKQLIKEDLQNVGGVAEKQIPMKVLGIARGLSVMKKEDISSLYDQLQSEFSEELQKDMFQNIFFDTLIMGGSYDNVQFIKEKIGSMTQAQKIAVFAFMPQYILTPTRGVLENIFSLVKSDEVQNQQNVYTHAILGFSTLLQRACLDENRNTSYPTNVFGNFCSPNSEILTVQWIPYLQSQLHSGQTASKNNAVLVALGLLSHKQILSAVLPQIEVTQENPDKMSSTQRMRRFLAVSALSNAGQYNREQVLPILSNIFINQGEDDELRMLSFNILMKLNPPMAVLHKIVASTWVEQNEQVLQVVNSAFYSLSQIQSNQQDPSWNSKANLAQKAYIVYPLMKKGSNRFPTSGTVMSSDNLRQLGVGYQGISAWIADRSGNPLPRDFYSKVEYFLGRYQFTPYEMAIRSNNGQNLVKQLAEIINPTGQSGNHGFGEQVSSQWRHVLEQLKPKAGQDESQKEGFSGAAYIKLFDNVNFMSTISSESSEMLREEIAPLLKNVESIKKFMDGKEFGMQRVINLSPSEFSIPSDMGFPIFIELHFPLVLSVRGSFKTQLSLKNPKVSVQMNSVIAGQVAGWVGTQCPFTKEYIVTGIDQHAVINFPGKMEIELNLLKEKLSIQLQNPNKQQEKFDFLHYHVRPFTVRQGLNDVSPLTLNKNIKFINTPAFQSWASEHPRDPQYNVQSYRIGEYLGVDANAIIKTQSSGFDFSVFMQKFRMYNYNPVNFLKYVWASTALSGQGKPSLRLHEFHLQYKPQSSDLSGIQMEFRIRQGQINKQQGIKHTVVKVEESMNSILPSIKSTQKSLEQISEPCEARSHLENALREAEIEEGHAATIGASITLQSKQQQSRTYVYNATISCGKKHQSTTQKWNVQLQSSGQDQQQKLCIDGQLDYAQSGLDIEKLRKRDQISFSYKNVIGFGSSCQDSKVIISGTSHTSEKQKQFSRESPEAQIYRKMEEQKTPLRDVSRIAEKVRSQATTQDKVDFEVKYVNFPQKYMYIPNAVAEYVKAYLVSYRQMNSSSSSDQVPFKPIINGGSGSEKINQETKVHLSFSPWNQNFNLTLQRPNEFVRFVRVRVGAPLSYLVPVSARLSNEIRLGGTQTKLGSIVGPRTVCYMQGNWLKNFQGQNHTMNLDRNWHVAAGNCDSDQSMSNGVLVKNETNSRNSKKLVKVYLGKTIIDIVPQSQGSDKLEMRINGTKVHFQAVFDSRVIRDEQGNLVAKVLSQEDGQVMQVDSVSYKLFLAVAKADLLRIDETLNRRQRLCGMCTGSGPQKCVYSKSETLTAAYRVSLDRPVRPSTSGLSHQQKEEIEAAASGEKCAKAEAVIPTKLQGGYRKSEEGGECMTKTQIIVRRSGKICFSKRQERVCSEGCEPVRSAGSRSLSGEYVCFPEESREGRSIAQKIEDGQYVDLSRETVSFRRSDREPNQCRRI